MGYSVTMLIGHIDNGIYKKIRILIADNKL